VTIWVPKTTDEKGPKYACTLCDKVFYEDEKHAYERHVVAGHSHEELREHSFHGAGSGAVRSELGGRRCRVAAVDRQEQRGAPG
jgi:uncharacterized C2H2 Zn-finger protein